jgi:subtilase family serine protease
MKCALARKAARLTLLFLCAAAASAAERQSLHTGVPQVAARLGRIERLPATNRLQLAIGLPLRNQGTLTNLFHQLYDRTSTNFHRFLTPRQFAEHFGPMEEEYRSVMDYSRSNRLDVVRTFGNRALVVVAGSVADIEGMFQVHLGIYQHPTEKRRFFAPDAEPSVEPGLPVLYVSGLDNYVIPHHNGHATPLAKNQIRLPRGGSDPGNTNLYLGTDFRNAYVPGTTLTGAGQVVGLFELDGYTSSDIQTYLTYAGLSSVPLNNVLGSQSPGKGNTEVASDIELTIAMAPGLAVVNVYEGNNNSSIMNEIASPSNGEAFPKQVSCSWGVEADTSIEQALIQMAMQGQSFFYASGDNGAYANGVNSGTEQNYRYMTGVGGTKLVMNGFGASWKSETVWHDNPPPGFNYFSSTGGVLPQVAIPDFQRSVSMALNNGSTQYRNVPDVAMVARDIRIVATSVPSSGPPVPGQFFSWVGTSAAAPLWAGLMALVNQQAAAQGKPPVGFLNPALYDIAGGPLYAVCFHDITTGNNTWTNTSAGTTSGNVYYAVPGYDLCTGWGTPASTALISALVGFSGPKFVDFNYVGSTQDGTYDHPFKTLAGGTNAVSSGGTIIIKIAGSSSETMTISKRMTITASDGGATIGH